MSAFRLMSRAASAAVPRLSFGPVQSHKWVHMGIEHTPQSSETKKVCVPFCVCPLQESGIDAFKERRSPPPPPPHTPTLLRTSQSFTAKHNPQYPPPPPI